MKPEETNPSISAQSDGQSLARRNFLRAGATLGATLVTAPALPNGATIGNQSSELATITNAVRWVQGNSPWRCRRWG
ncbi:twin-arginine translocation signal domain-containing protein [Spirosoma taeanense]|uniref:Twin-arginine translocation signal domain-containing protein n=1 Tax=Spirosoma taeanense TaxID=2735870 RepID=A0A6M5Y500_9BACT|nr:twin-arginine translocation signal domain-containing protein [Spirosoma taeanense]